MVLREAGRPVSAEIVVLDPPRRDEVLVRVAAAGVCHSDVHLADGLLGPGRAPMVLGHEGAGIVEAVGDEVADVRPGDHVVFCFVPSCGACRSCREGRPTLCEPAGRNGVAGVLMDGTSRLRDRDGRMLQHGLMVACFAEMAVVSRGGVVPIPEAIPLWQAALLGCGVVTAFGAVRKAGVGTGDSVCVIGCGGVGLQVIAAARLAGATPIVAVDRGDAKLEHALRRGASHSVDASRGRVVEGVLEITDGGVDHALEVVGTPATIRQAWEVLRPGGGAVVIGLSPTGIEVSLPAIEFLSEKSITGSYYGSGNVAAALTELSALVTEGRLDVGDVVTDVIGLDDVESAFERLRRGEGGRSVILIDEELAGRRL